MKKILVIIMFLPIYVSAQTKEETEKWILNQLPYDSYFTYSFSNKYLMSTFYIYQINSTTVNSIPLDAVKTISVDYSTESMGFIFKCDNRCNMQMKTDGEYKAPKRSEPASVRDKSHLDMDTVHKKVSTSESFMLFIKGRVDKTMIPRLEKAFLHLIELNGGKAKLVPYKAKKEAF